MRLTPVLQPVHYVQQQATRVGVGGGFRVFPKGMFVVVSVANEARPHSLYCRPVRGAKRLNWRGRPQTVKNASEHTCCQGLYRKPRQGFSQCHVGRRDRLRHPTMDQRWMEDRDFDYMGTTLEGNFEDGTAPWSSCRSCKERPPSSSRRRPYLSMQGRSALPPAPSQAI